MLTLEQQQLAVQALIKRQPLKPSSASAADPWVNAVAKSSGLKMIHRIGSWWQRFQLESQCRYTTRLLKRMNCFESYVDDHFRLHPTPPSVEELSCQFLQTVQHDGDRLLNSVAHFELACFDLINSPSDTRTIIWDRDPSLVLKALQNFSALPEPEPNATYITVLSSMPDGSVKCAVSQNYSTVDRSKSPPRSRSRSLSESPSPSPLDQWLG